MIRVKIKESVDGIQFIKDCGLSTDIVYTTYKRDDGGYEIHGFVFDKDELEFLD